jgi:hypothetical protein
LPEELPSVETTLKTLAAALEGLKTPGLEKNDVFRLRCIIAGAKVYKELLSNYMNYRGLEAELMELREKYAEFSKKSRAFSPIGCLGACEAS